MTEYKIIKNKLVENKKLNLSENIVIEHNNYFYKAPNPLVKLFLYKNTNPYEYLVSSYKIIKDYFGNICNVVKTEVLQDNEFGFVVKQDKIDGKVFSKSDLNNITLQNKFKLLLKNNEKLWIEKGYSLDFLGAQIFYKPFNLHNLMVKDNEIYLFDFGLLNKNSKSFVIKYFSRIGYFIQNIILKFYL